MFRTMAGGERRKAESPGAGQCENSSLKVDAEQIRRMGRKRILHFQFAALFAASEYY